MKQKKICRWLKGLTVLLGTMGVAFFGGVTVLAFYMRQQNPQDPVWSFVFFSWYTAVLCYGVLFQFWNVCTQIGRDNSFSLENVRSFHRMAMLGVAAGAGYLVRMVYLIAAGGFRWPAFLYNLALILLSVVFVTLCEALSQLVRNAYEVKRENELSI